MRGLRGLLAGAMALIALEVLTSDRASRYTAGLLKIPGRWARRFLDPTLPAIADHRGDDQQAGSGGSGLAGGLRGRRAASTSGSSGTRYPSPFAVPSQLRATTGGG